MKKESSTPTCSASTRRKTVSIRKNRSPIDWCLFQCVMHNLELAAEVRQHQQQDDCDDDFPIECMPKPIEFMPKLQATSTFNGMHAK